MEFENSGKTWLNDEVTLLRERFNTGQDLEALCRAHGRRPYAIVGKLQNMGLLILVGYNYHMVSPEPWILNSVVKQFHDKWVEHKGE